MAPDRIGQRQEKRTRYAFFAALAGAFFLAAHRWPILSDAAFRCAAVKARLLLFGCGAAAAEAVAASGFFGPAPSSYRSAR